MKKQNSEVENNNKSVNSYQEEFSNGVDIEEQAMNGLYGMLEPSSDDQLEQ